MTYKTIIETLNKDDLVDILSTALYGSDIFTADWETKYDKYTKQGDCFEEKLADILLNGGEIMIIDKESYENEEPYGHKGDNWNSTSIEEFSYYSFLGIQTANLIAYHITLNSIINSINKHQEAQDLAKELLIDEEGDLFTAQNLLQYICFDKLIYG